MLLTGLFDSSEKVHLLLTRQKAEVTVGATLPFLSTRGYALPTLTSPQSTTATPTLQNDKPQHALHEHLHVAQADLVLWREHTEYLADDNVDI